MIFTIKIANMYSSKRDAFIYGDDIPLYRILYIKNTLKKVDKMIKKEIKKQNRKKNIVGNKIYENGVNGINVNKRKVSFDLD
jgi:hypothetical protein